MVVWWMSAVATQLSGFIREGDLHAAGDLRQAIASHDFDKEFMFHLIASVTFEKHD